MVQVCGEILGCTRVYASKGLIGLIPRDETEGKGHLYVAPLVPERKLNQRKKAFPF